MRKGARDVNAALASAVGIAQFYNAAMESSPPLLTDRFGFAFQFAAALHRQQVRKGTSIPYIAHLMSVSALVLEAGGDEDQAIAALLHDAVEDQGGLPTLETIRRLFGERVAETVRECSDSESADPTKKAPWHERKRKYLEHLRSASKDAVLVSVADKLHNARDIVAAHRRGCLGAVQQASEQGRST